MARARLALLAAIVAAAFAGAMPSTASAACNSLLEDSQAFDWDLEGAGPFSGAVGDGQQDAFDSVAALRVDTEDDGFEADDQYQTVGPCGFADGDRTVLFPAATMGGLEVSREFFVPASGPPFARWLNILHNPTGAAIEVDVASFNASGTNTSALRVRGTSSGDVIVTVDDTWAAVDDDGAGPDTPAGYLWDGIGSKADSTDVFNALNRFVSSTNRDHQPVWLDVEVPAGGTYIYMQIGTQRATSAENIAFAQQHGVGSETVYAGLSATERSQLRNWPTWTATERATPAT